MNKPLIITAIGEVATGLALLFVPSLVGELLLGEALTGSAIPMARIGGIALIGLGVACWPGQAVVGMMTYSFTVAAYLAYLGVVGGFEGVLLVPAIILHVVLTILLARTIGRDPPKATLV